MSQKEAKGFGIQKAGVYLRDRKNLVLRYLGLLRLSTIILALTDRCNLKCAMCDIWERKAKNCAELDLEKIRGMFRLKALKNIKQIFLTGGEPFLRKDLYEVVLAAKDSHPRSSITISSNGTLTGQILDFLHKALRHTDISLEFSLLGVKTHDHISGVEGSFANLERTIDEVRDKFPSLDLKAKFVITPWNYLAIKETADYCRRKKIPLMLKSIENVESYTNSLRYRQNLENKSFVFNVEQLKSIIDALKDLRSNPLVNPLRTEYLISSLGGRETGKKCLVPFVSLFVNSEGSVYRCRMRGPVGSINKTPSRLVAAGDRLSRGRLDDDQICGQCGSFLRFLM